MKNLLISLLMGSAVMAFGQSVPDNWYLDEVNPGADIALYPDESVVQDGDRSCRMELLQPEVPYLISDNFAVNAGDNYKFTIFYLDNDTTASLKFYADFYDDLGNDIWGEDPVWSENGEGWQEITWSATVPAFAVQGYILIKLYDDPGYVDNAVVWVDNAMFQVGEDNLVLNGSYEFWPGVGIKNPGNLYEYGKSYPNPAGDYVYFTDLKDVTLIQINNITGQLVKSVSTEGRERISLHVADLVEGVYFATFYNGSTLVQTSRVLKR